MTDKIKVTLEELHTNPELREDFFKNPDKYDESYLDEGICAAADSEALADIVEEDISESFINNDASCLKEIAALDTGGLFGKYKDPKK